MSASRQAGHPRKTAAAAVPAAVVPAAVVPAAVVPAAVVPAAGTDPLASDRDEAGVPVHRGWAPLGGRRRWMEPFLLVILAGGAAHGYAIIGDLEEMGITSGSIDIGQVYRTLRELEQAGQVTSTWSTEAQGPQRRDYELTAVGYEALDEWAAVMKERARLIGEFDGRYLESVASERHPRK
jgi:PadR family transcriptional regulator PadR